MYWCFSELFWITARQHVLRSWSCWGPILGGEEEVVGISDGTIRKSDGGFLIYYHYMV